MEDDWIELIAGRFTYYVTSERIKAFPDSYFAKALEPHWNTNSGDTKQLRIDQRNVNLFVHIVDYLRFGCIPRSKDSDCLIDRKLLPELRVEADYFCLHEMVAEIDGLMSYDTPTANALREGLTIVNALNFDSFNIGNEYRSLLRFAAKKDDKSKDHTQEIELSEAHSDAYYPYYFAMAIDTQCNYDEECINTNKIVRSIPFIYELDCFEDISLSHALVHTNEQGSFEKTMYNNCLYVFYHTDDQDCQITVTTEEEEVFVVDALPFNSGKCTIVFIKEGCKVHFACISENTNFLVLMYRIHQTIEECEYGFGQKYFENIRIGKGLLLQELRQEEFFEILIPILTDHDVGIILYKDYIEEGLRVEALDGFEATIYNKLDSIGVSIKLVYGVTIIDKIKARKYKETASPVYLLDDDRFNDNLDKEDLSDCFIIKPFIDCGTLISSYNLQDEDDMERRIVAVMILRKHTENVQDETAET